MGSARVTKLLTSSFPGLFQVSEHCAVAVGCTLPVRQNKQGTPVWYLMAKDEGHGYQKKSNQDFQFYASVLFLKQYLMQ